ncbi:SapC family protein [Pollutimonas harenae]|uniref:SapC family protein n=1 Tax=Pollutimonas harenae TaxID=657015 RepID=A0A853GS62_9BURK|nr:SapC family protein [Pollutimonas harenae]NYT85948.1 SapC family protein [Pollutimonas harenae]TEA70998.1 SapC family protein [Pollutimonas harenae]
MTSTALPLFYKQPQALQPGLHAKLSLAKQPNYAFAASANSVPLVSSEMAAACRHYPIVFTEGEQPAPVAVLGLRGQENLFINADGQWQANSYIPAYIRRYPFIFLENADQFTLCVDTLASSVVESAENSFFDNEGKPSELTRNALEFCREYQSQHAYTLEFSRALAEADLLVDNKADITLPNGQHLTLSGFKVIDEAKFNALPEQEFLRWRAKGWLTLVYCHLISVATWNNLLSQVKPD